MMGLLETKCKRRAFIGNKPADVPENATIYNAPRPLVGQTMWTGDFYAGVFYASVDPAHHLAEKWDARNVELDATVLVYFDENQAIDMVTNWYREKYDGEWDRVADILSNMSVKNFVDRFLDMMNEGDIVI